MADPALGTKQICPNDQTKFYDLNRRPAHCPKCETEFDPEEALKLRSRRTRPGYPADDEAEDQVVTEAAIGASRLPGNSSVAAVAGCVARRTT